MSRFEAQNYIITNGLVLNLDAGDPDSYTRSQPPYVEVLVVAGGGSGGSSVTSNGGGGGGGAGGVIYNSAYQLTSATAVTVTVGSGGPGQTSNTTQGNNGSNSVFGSLTAVGGGGGGSASGGNTNGGNGGSGGGAGYVGYYNNFNSGTGTAGQGFRGGYVLANNNAGGGGGAGGVGEDTYDSRPEPGYPAGNGGLGGPGVYYSISGTSTLYSTGGNGGSQNQNTIVSGSGTKGIYGSEQTSGGSATAATGIVIVRYPGLPAATGGTITYLNGYTIHTFTTSGTFTPYAWNDVSGNNNSGSLINGVGFNSYQNGGYLSFDGVDDRVATSFKPSGYRSYFVWIKYNITSSLPAGYSLTGTQESNAFNYVGIENGGKFYYYFGTNGESLAGTVLSPNVWYYQGLTLSNDGNARAYLNSTLVSTLASGVGTTATAEFSVGCINQNYWVNGSIASVMQYNRTLTQAEITQNYNAQKSRFGL